MNFMSTNWSLNKDVVVLVFMMMSIEALQFGNTLDCQDK